MTADTLTLPSTPTPLPLAASLARSRAVTSVAEATGAICEKGTGLCCLSFPPLLPSVPPPPLVNLLPRLILLPPSPCLPPFTASVEVRHCNGLAEAPCVEHTFGTGRVFGTKVRHAYLGCTEQTGDTRTRGTCVLGCAEQTGDTRTRWTCVLGCAEQTGNTSTQAMQNQRGTPST